MPATPRSAVASPHRLPLLAPTLLTLIGGWAMAFAAVFGAVLVAASSARAHGGVSIGIGFGFPVFVGAPIYAPPVYYVPTPGLLQPTLCGLLRSAAAIQASLSPGTPLSSLLLLLLISHERHGLGIDVLELGIAIHVRVSFFGFAIALQTIPCFSQQPTDRARAGRMILFGQFPGQRGGALGGPAQRGPRVATRRRIHQRLQRGQQPGLGVDMADDQRDLSECP